MLTLALESSAKAASAALVRDGALLALYFQNSGLTHSRTLLPMAEDILKNTDTALRDVGLIAVAHGPGSFTGIRIGVSAAKGLSWASGIPVCGVSTLEALAFAGMAAPEGALICAVMDARREQVYNALFRFESRSPRRLCPDRAVSMEQLGAELKEYGGCPVFIAGDGADLFHAYLSAAGHKNAVLSPENVRLQNAWGVAMAADKKPSGDAGSLVPVYLRASQAERERRERLAGEKSR